MTPVLAAGAALFGLVVVGVVLVAVIVGLLGGLLGRDVYGHIGRGGIGDGSPPAGPEPREGQREEEIGQMLAARRDRAARRAATAPPLSPVPTDRRPSTDPPEVVPGRKGQAAIGDGLAEELRQLALAHNARRLRRGLEPLDVDAEVARRLREL